MLFIFHDGEYHDSARFFISKHFQRVKEESWTKRTRRNFSTVITNTILPPLSSLILTGPQLAVVDDEPTNTIRLQAENRIQDEGDEIRSIRQQPTSCARFYNSRCGRKWKESRRKRRTFEEEEEEEYIDGFHRRWPPLPSRRCRLERGGGKE